MNNDSHQPYEDDLAAYLLDALPSDEVRALELHLEGCDRCRERERWLRSAVDLLPSSVEQVQPPPELRERLMATVRAEAAAEGAAADADAPQTRRERRPSVWHRLFGRRPLAVGFATAFIIAAGIAGFVIGSNGGEGGENGTTTVIQAQTGAASLERRGDEGTLQVERLRPRDNGVYQVWIASAGKNPESAGVFDVRADGRGSARIRKGLDQADEVLVTPEPPGGSPQPTANPVLRIRV